MDRFDTSRPDQVTDVAGSTTVVASMLYLGLGTLVELKYEGASNLKLTYEQGGTGTAGDKYKGLDRFGRIVETVWIKGFGDVVQSLYGHNRASSILWRKDEEVSNTIAMDAYYEYDGLQQVTEWKRGNLSPSTGPPFTGVTSQKQGEDFTYDQTGNWLGDVSDTPNFTQNRTHDVKNQITSITGPSGVIQPDYDNAGNMTLAPSPGSWTAGYAYKWDAWSRLVEIKQGGTVIGSYAYDALTRRTPKTVGGVTRDIYYDRQWRSVEEREGSTVKVQHTWSPLDRWTLIRRKRSVSGTLDESLFCLRDYLDPVALANTSGNVVERYSYDAFGTVQIMDAAFAVRSSSAYEWDFLYHGEFRDKESELYNYGYRYLDTQLGRWLSRDPIGERGGRNLYALLDNGPVSAVDVFGLKECCCCAERLKFKLQGQVVDRTLGIDHGTNEMALRWEVSFKNSGENECFCSLEWYEWNNNLGKDELALGMKNREWETIYPGGPQLKDNATFLRWEHRSICSDRNGSIGDAPKFGTRTPPASRLLFIMVILKSNKNCECSQCSVTAWVVQYVEVDGGGKIAKQGAFTQDEEDGDSNAAANGFLGQKANIEKATENMRLRR